LSSDAVRHDVRARAAFDGLREALGLVISARAPRSSRKCDRLDLGAHAARREVALRVERLDLFRGHGAQRALARACRS
jgi:hypothetical protein